jgi:uncharacterized membrane protein YfcA
VWLTLGLLGVVGGAVTASTAVGWGLVTMPTLLLGFQFPAPVAVRMSVLGFTGCLAVMAWHARTAGTMNWPNLLALLIGGVIGGLFGTVITDLLPARLLERAIGVATVAAGLAILFRQ